ncbi:MAG: HAMP domain-containing histidine kinase [Fimbriiglobus sp.]|nr:HAMP domain-containing histidine kinase [Fimbriiglobus sp.]
MKTAATHPVLARAWLRPSDAALLALADDQPSLDVVRRDPGLVLHFLRYARPTPLPDSLVFDESALAQPGLCETAASILETEGTPSPLDVDAVARGLALAEASEAVAAETGNCSPDAAWCVGLLAGYFADTPAVARKALARWRLPAWVTVAVGFPELPVQDGVALGGHRGVLEVIRARRAVLRQDQGSELLTPTMTHPTTANPLWPRLLRLAAKARRRSAVQLVSELEGRIDSLTTLLAESRQDFDAAVRDAKLDGLAEFAAGAGHEINNPLAVIATNVQLLRGEEDDEARLARYDAVLRQTKRIHDLLAGTRQFARPPEPNPALLGASAWVPAVAKDLQPAADDAGVRLELPDVTAAAKVWADAAHVRAVVIALGRNAVDAAGRGGWVRVVLSADDECSRVLVEDSGPGPTAAMVPHLFDPFYSGRNAGRGRGLGLSVAWRLAKQNGGDVRYERADGVTRFVLTLPNEPADYLPLPERRTA